MNAPRSIPNGFTLVEIIVTLTVSSVLVVLLLQFMGTSISRSVQPLDVFQGEMALQRIMESMNADYKHLLLTDGSPLDTFKARVESHHYGAYTVLASNYIAFDATQTETPCDITLTDCNLLKVKITSGSQSLTSIFAR